MGVAIQMPMRHPNELEENYIRRCQLHVYNELLKHGIGLDNFWPSCVASLGTEVPGDQPVKFEMKFQKTP
jgi:hypothetical protein